MITTRFEERRTGEAPLFMIEIEMPFPLRVGDTVEVDRTGYEWRVKKVTWVIYPGDALNNELITLTVEVE